MLRVSTKWKPKNTVNLLQICTKETYFKDFEANIWHMDPYRWYSDWEINIWRCFWDFMESYENEFVPYPNSKFIFWKSKVDDVNCLWQYGEGYFQGFLYYPNGCHTTTKWTIEVENEGKYPFVDLSVCGNLCWISAGIYRKGSHTLKYSTFSSNRRRVGKMGIIKILLH